MQVSRIERWSRRLTTVVVLSGLFVVLGALTAQARLSPFEFESCLLDKINNDRAASGAGSLARASDGLDVVRGWSEWMSTNTFRHMTSSERELALPDGTFAWGENIAMHSLTEGDCSDVHSALMRSGGHRANILSTSFRFATIGAHADSSGWWVTELFFDAEGYPPAPAPDQCEPDRDCDTLALQSSGGLFALWDEVGSPGDVWSFYYGNPGDVAFSGDWDCDGVETLGLYRQSDGYAYLRNSNTQGVADISFFFGNPGDFPVSGDFNGDGCDTVSIYRPSEARFYIINELGSNDGGLGAADYSFLFGDFGDKPFVGDFDGDGVDTVGLHRESTGLVYFRNSNSSGAAEIEFVFGAPGDRLIAGDWDGDGVDTVAVFRPSTGMVYLRNSNTAGVADAQVFAGFQAGISDINP